MYFLLHSLPNTKINTQRCALWTFFMIKPLSDRIIHHITKINENIYVSNMILKSVQDTVNIQMCFFTALSRKYNRMII